MIKYYDAPEGADPDIQSIQKQRIYPKDKLQRNVGLNFSEKSEFSGICQFGAEQLIGCYGKYTDDGFSSHDFRVMCKSCPYSLNTCAKMRYDSLISEPFFIKDLFEDFVDDDKEKPEYFVYFISDGEYVKIGITDNIKARLSQLQTSNARKLNVLWLIPTKDEKSACKLESSLHSIYERFCVSGEWFNILDFIKKDEFDKIFSAKYYMDEQE